MKIKNTPNTVMFTIVNIITLSQFVTAQFIMDGVIPQRYGRTTTTGTANNVQAIAVGNFDFNLGRIPAATLHVNSNFVTNPFYGAGEVFRTDCPAGQTTSWRLLRGNTHYGRFFNNTGQNHFRLQSNAGDMVFHTGGGATMDGRERFRIFDSTGFAGFGNTATFTAQSEVHIHDTTTTYLQFTNTTTQGGAPTATDGFVVGINSSTAELRQQEDQDMQFFTGTAGDSRMVVKGVAGPTQGFVAVGTNFTAPAHIVDVRTNLTDNRGAINIGNGTGTSPQGYRIGENYVLRHRGDVSNIFVGENIFFEANRAVS